MTTPRLLLLALVVLLQLSRAGPAQAQGGAPEVSAAISSDRVEVDQPFTVQLRALTEGDDMPTDPQLYVPGGIDVSGPSVTAMRITRRGGGGSVEKRGIGASWQLTARRQGRYTIPAPTVQIAGQRVSAGRTMRVQVTAATGRRPQRGGSSAPSGSSPLGWPGTGSSFPFQFKFNLGTPFGDPFDDLFERRDSLSPDGRKLAMKAEPDRFVFLRAIVDKTRAVVGEQVTLSLYVYYRADFEMRDRHEAPLADFLRVPMLTSPGTTPPVTTRVGDRRYLARLLDRVGIFPLRAGRLHTGSLSARFTGRRIGTRVERKTKDLTIEAHEPPVEDRPPGYRLGDVGRFRLSATVKPREIDAGGAVAVLVRLQGEGALPHSLALPERTGVEWIDPEKKGETTVENQRVGGWRTFGYVVRLHDPGKRYLGRIELPYFDPRQQSYEVASADLGNVVVADAPTAGPQRADGGAAAGPTEEESASPFASIGPLRRSLGPVAPVGNGQLDPRRFWALVAVPPAAVALVALLRRGARRIARRRAARRQDAGSLAERALGQMKRAKDPLERVAAAERALHHGIDAATGIKSRGILLDDLPAELRRHGVGAEQCERICETLARCSTLRFEPNPPEEAVAELPGRVTPLVRELGRSGHRRNNGVAKTAANADAAAGQDDETSEAAVPARRARRRHQRPPTQDGAGSEDRG